MSTPAIERLDDTSLAAAVAELCVVEPRFRQVVDVHGLPSLRAAEGGVAGLLMIVTEQFLSLAAAQAIWERVSRRLAPFEPAGILATDATELVALGLSRAKARSFHAIALACIEKRFDPESLAALPDDAVRAHLMPLPGVGPWTADIYLLSCLLRPDAWPHGDVALQEAARDLFHMPERPSARAMREFGLAFSPWRAVAARLLWSHYRGLRGMGQALSRPRDS